MPYIHRQPKSDKFESEYVAHTPDAAGTVNYTPEENKIWNRLITRQLPIVKNRGCKEYLAGLEILDFPHNRIPQCPEVSNKLSQTTGWSVKPVNALIPHTEFFELLKNRVFPAATFIRDESEIDYLKEPDIFHEFFGHLPMLTHPEFADFMQAYGELACAAPEQYHHHLARLYWFTVEFGLIHSDNDLRIYGGGILSSKQETIYALEDTRPNRQPYNTLMALRTPYRIDQLQKNYFIIDNYQVLYKLVQNNLLANIDEARKLGDFK